MVLLQLYWKFWSKLDLMLIILYFFSLQTLNPFASQNLMIRMNQIFSQSLMLKVCLNSPVGNFACVMSSFQMTFLLTGFNLFVAESLYKFITDRHHNSVPLCINVASPSFKSFQR